MLTLYLKLLTFFKKFAQINFTTMYYTHAGIQDFPRVSYTINYLMNNNLWLYIINMSTNCLVRTRNEYPFEQYVLRIMNCNFL